MNALDMPFVHYVGDSPNAAAKHFFGLREALPNLSGVALFDRINLSADKSSHLLQLVWEKREIENYFCSPGTLRAFIEESVNSKWQDYPLLKSEALDKHILAMEESVSEIANALEALGKGVAWSDDLKSSDEFLAPFFRRYYEKLGLPNIMEKSNFHKLVEFVPNDELTPEVAEKLDSIVEVALSASQ